MAVIKVRISPDGSNTEIKVEGVAGAGCEEMTRTLEQAIFQAGEVDKEHTPDYYMDEVNVLSNRI